MAKCLFPIEISPKEHGYIEKEREQVLLMSKKERKKKRK